MRKLLKTAAIVMGSLLVLLVLATAVLALIGGARLNKSYDVRPEPVAVSADPAVLQRGQYLVATACVGCHGEDLGGTPFFQDPALGRIPAPNLTSGQAGIGSTYDDDDLALAIRHGVNKDGKRLMIMPSDAFWHYSDEDLGAVIAYMRSVPPVDNDLGERSTRLLGQVLVGAGLMDVLAADRIDHARPRPDAPAQQVNAAYGQYLANISDCRSCHGAALAGGRSSEPGAPPGPNLTPGGDLATWTVEDFVRAMRTGVTPAGDMLNPAFMPWPVYGRMTDDDLAALFLYLQSLPATEPGTE
jgi:mono/diheme cytochrome c family protein